MLGSGYQRVHSTKKSFAQVTLLVHNTADI